jgi:hypothetical protein
MERERRLAETQLLAQLEYGDAALADLSTLWYHERGPEAAARLKEADEWTTRGPRYWSAAEQALRALMDEYGFRWAEPVNRLATLCYLQGRLQEAEHLCKIVLAVKPWHHRALSEIVMVYAGRKETERARQWATRRLPTYSPDGLNRRRCAWVREAVTEARTALEEQKEILKATFGVPDEHAPSDDDWQ